ncbi:MAG: DegT/DnrJ/EryC1/StrS family aminotransferase [Elusimicrobia bacterium]|nr:DegT/DnrJ/EryC1/StrS family aminotransferase [Elusimicrobiota bacterium]
MKISMVNLQAEYPELKDEVEQAVKKIFEKSNFVLGEEMENFEKEFARFCQTKYAAGVASGTDAIRIALMACGIKNGDEVITTPFTFIATVEAIRHAGATPVFADIIGKTYNIDPAQIEKKITSRTKALLPVHLYGHPAEMEPILETARKHKLFVIEDCAQSCSAKYKTGGAWKYVGSLGDCGAFSFFPAKNLGCFGDGGAITTDNREIYEKILTIRNHGQTKRYHSEIDGFNSRLDTLQAAVLSIKLKRLGQWTERRNRIAEAYNRLLKDTAAVPVANPNARHSFNYYTICFADKDTREDVQKHLLANGIACQIYYPISAHLQKAMEYLGYKKGDLPVAEDLQDRILSLPMSPKLLDEEIRVITDEVKHAVKLCVKKG